MLNFYDFIQVYVFTTNHHLNVLSCWARYQPCFSSKLLGPVPALFFKQPCFSSTVDPDQTGPTGIV